MSLKLLKINLIELIIEEARIEKMDSREIEKRLFINSKENNRNRKITNSYGVDISIDEYRRAVIDEITETQGLLPPKGGLPQKDSSNSCEYTWSDFARGLAPIYYIDRHRLSTDGNGVTTLVAFHKCLLRCKYCINPQTWQADEVFQKLSAKELYEEVKKDNLYFLATGGGITFGGGEPCLYSDYIVEFRDICNPKWNLTIETSLWVGESHIKNLLSVIDYWIIDVKDMDNKRYKKYTGSSNSLMIKNLKCLIKHGKQMLVRVPYIKGYNTRDDVNNNVAILRELGVVNIDTFDYKTSNDTKNNDYHLTGSPQRVEPYVIDDSLPF